MRLLKAVVAPVMAAVVLGGMMTSCTPPAFPLTPQALQSRGLKPGEGYIVATFHEVRVGDHSTMPPYGVDTHVSIEPPGSGTGLNVPGRVLLTPTVCTEGENPFMTGFRNHSDVLAIPVPAGSYEVTGWSMTASVMTSMVTVRNRLPMSVPFQVKPGEATYVGRLNGISFYGKNLLGLSVFGRGMVIVTDEFGQDQARIAKAYPSIKAGTIRHSGVPAGYQNEMKRIAQTPDESGWRKYLFH